MRLNREQQRAVDTTEGPVLVLAGAGTGKTRVLTSRIAHLMKKGVPPARILAVTFTNKAAREMRERVAKAVGKIRARDVVLGTFHAFCARALREAGERFSICDSADQLSAARSALRDLHVPETRMHPRALLGQVSLGKSRCDTWETTLESDELLGHAWRRYEEHLQRGRALDFDDLLLEGLALARRDSGLQKRFRYVLVDEYQDTNRPQYELVRALAASRNLFVVGDDDQSIYGWRGADVRNILDFQRDYPDAVVVKLETNYRSTERILDAANKVIRHNPQRHDKTLRSARGSGTEVRIFGVEDEEREARGVVTDIVNRVKDKSARYGECAVLFRTAVQPRAFEAVLRAQNVPYVLVGGNSFFDRKEVRDVLAYLKLLANPDDEASFLRVLNVPPRGLGKTTVEKVLAFATAQGVSAPRAFARIGEVEGVPAAASDAYGAFHAALAPLRGADPGRRLVGYVRDLLTAVDYEAELVRCYPDALARDLRRAGLDEILNLAENYVRETRAPTLGGFLERLALTTQEDTADRDAPRDAVTLMTLHAAKGLEFPHVYVVGCEEGLLPHEKSVQEDRVEEERRLMYVGITRAQATLTLTHAKQRAVRGRRGERFASRFLYELRGRAVPDDWRPAGAPPARGKEGVRGRRGARLQPRA